MERRVLPGLAGETAEKTYLMATVANGCVIIRDPDAASQTAISLSRLSNIRTLRASYPGLLAIASGLSVIAAAAYCSKEGDGAALPSALLGLSFLAGYGMTRKAALAFVVGSEVVRTTFGSPADARRLLTAIRLARAGGTLAEEEKIAECAASTNQSLPEAAYRL